MFSRHRIPPIVVPVVLHTKDGRSFGGLLPEDDIDRPPRVYVLKSAVLFPGREKIVGEATIDAENVSWLQRNVPADLIAPPEAD